MAIQWEGCNGHSSDNTSVEPYPEAGAKYEEVVQSAELFWEKLEAFHRSFGTTFLAPMIGGKALDLHHLFVEITSRGGIKKVIRDRRWKEVTVLFNFPTPLVSISFVLRKHYLSLLYHFEQVYYFHKKTLFLSDSDVCKEAPVTGQFSEEPKLQLGCSVTGNIDAKIDNGYLISVNFGSEQLKGVLYHCPGALHSSGDSVTSEIVPHQDGEKSSSMAIQDPSLPKPRTAAYGLFYAEQYPRLKLLFPGQDKAICKEIEFLWSKLTEAQKQVYQEKGEEDEERCTTESLD